SLQLSTLGYEICGIYPGGEEALLHLKDEQPDIMLLDIQLKGKLDGIETAQLMQKDYNIPVIYLTANADDAHFDRAKATNPYAFISKPFKKTDLKRAVELTVNRIMAKDNEAEGVTPSYVLSDRIFVKDHEKMVKIIIKDIYYIEADRNYCRIFSKEREYLLVMTLKDMEDKLPPEHFVRIHRSYIVNIFHIDEVAGSYVVIFKKALPMSKLLRNGLLKRLQTI
ncbi:MAG: LytTR family transcriptional regulator DNA-binding domain-containing protein, partial [Bacteroidota bacterium]|nr:LytTR family transcriptional regulator DNA-binding domain-containing protein [Bacteroidota bacterium]